MSKQLTEEQQAFMDAFKDTHDQYGISDEDIEAFLRGNDKSFDGYTQLADAYNLWSDALNYARRNIC
jgi:hypothetical protein